MSAGIEVDPEELRAHASNLHELIQRFENVRSASAAIAEAPEAFGPLCEWMAGILEEKHALVDPLIDQGKANLDSHVDAINECAAAYEDSDVAAAKDLDDLFGEI